MLRLKGLVRVLEDARPLLVQSVGTLFSPPRPFGGAADASSLVVIGLDVDVAEITAVLPGLPLAVTTSARAPAAGQFEAVEV